MRTSDGRSVPGATAYLVRSGVGLYSTQTDDNGQYRFDQVPVGAFELFVHGGEDGGALREVVLYANGENVANATLSAFRNFPQLLTYRDIGLEERVSEGKGDLGPVVPWETLARAPAPHHQLRFWHDRNATYVVDIDFHTGVQTRVQKVPTGLTMLGGHHAISSPATDRSFAVYDLETGGKIATLNANYFSAYAWWSVFPDGRVLIKDTVNVRMEAGNWGLEEIHFDERVALFSGGIQTTSDPLVTGEAARGIDVIGVNNDHIFFSPNINCDSDACRPALWHVFRLDLHNMQSTRVAAFPSSARAVGAILVDAGDIIVPRRLGATEWVISLVDLETDTFRDLFSSESETEIRVLAATTDYVAWISQINGTARLWLGRSGMPKVMIAEAAGFTFLDQHDDRLLVTPFTHDRARPGFILVDLSSGRFLNIPLQPTGLDEPLCADRGGVFGCTAMLMPGGRVLAWDAIPEAGTVLRRDLVIQASIEEAPRGQSWLTKADAPWPSLASSADGTREVVFRVDKNGLLQMFSGPTGAEPDSFQRVTFFGGDSVEFLDWSPDGSALFYLDTDPISGYRQLFRRRLEVTP
ncbi:MAG: carboxypeptidase regulatory-like domain-containing protein [Deltaproteobacteria bacterium]|nr:carboxypeptidase regulatory-like domain-containing protein [Deltaproteobacteria bacterium]